MIKTFTAFLFLLTLVPACSTHDDIQIRRVVQTVSANDVSAADKELLAYSKFVSDKTWRQPQTKEERDLQEVGAVGVFEVSIRSDGNIEGMRIRQSTGNKNGDEAILGRIRSASPFPPPPALSIGTSGVLRLVYRFGYAKKDEDAAHTAPGY